MFDIVTNIDYCAESDDGGACEADEISTSSNRESTRTHRHEKVEKLVLIETQKCVDGRIFLIYSIQNSHNNKNFMIAQELDEENSDDWKCKPPVDCEVETLSQVLDFIISQKYPKSGASIHPPDEHTVKKRKHTAISKKVEDIDRDRVREGFKEGIVHSWNNHKGYGFVKEDETSQNIFFHMSRIVHKDWVPRKGERVEYKLLFDSNKMRDTAIGVSMVHNTKTHDHMPNYRQDRRDYGYQAYAPEYLPSAPQYSKLVRECEY
jgi:cold shock CspA family protein